MMETAGIFKRSGLGLGSFIGFIVLLHTVTGFASDRVVYQEKFNSSPWAEANDDNKLIQLENGTLHFAHHKHSGNWFLWKVVKLNLEGDYVISVDLAHLSGENTYGYGIFWAMKDIKNYYTFNLANNGYYRVGEVRDNSFIKHIPWTKIKNAEVSKSGTKRLTIRKEGRTTYFFINGIFMNSLELPVKYGKKIGFVIWNNQHITIDNLKIVQLSGVDRTVLDDTFSRNSHKWVIRDNAEVRSKVTSGEYVISKRIKDERFWLSYNTSYLESCANYEIEVILYHRDGVDNYGYGMAWEYKDTNNFYSMQVTGNGYVRVSRFLNNKEKKLFPWKQLPVVRQGNAENRLKIRKVLNTITAYLNGSVIAQVPYAGSLGNKVGFIVFSRQTIAVDRLTIRRLPLNTPPPQIKKIVPTPIVQPTPMLARDTTGPTIKVTRPAVVTKGLTIRARETRQRIEGLAIDSSGILEVTVNQQPAGLKADGFFWADVPLVVGKNKVTIAAVDRHGNKTLKELTITRAEGTYVPPSSMQSDTENEIQRSSTSGHNYLMIIGIDTYRYWPHLNNAVKDAVDVRDLLIKRYQFSKDKLVFLKNEEATKARIYEQFQNYARSLKGDDRLLIYYSGHGYYDKVIDEGYWVPVDAHRGAEVEYLPNSIIIKMIRAIKSKHTFLVADSCFSGSLFSQGSRGYVDNVEQFPSRWGLTSGRLEAVSDGVGGRNSPFASYFIKFLRNNRKKKVPVSELVQYVKTAVGNNSEQTPQGNPIRNTGDEGGEFVFHLKPN